MEKKYTPGPWKQELKQFHKDGEIYHEHDYYEISSGLGFQKDEDGSGFGITGYMNEANAKLIAAAPEILEALIDLERFAPSVGDERPTAFDSGLVAAIKKAKEAIKKATE
jgi:hypothetical protein